MAQRIKSEIQTLSLIGKRPKKKDKYTESPKKNEDLEMGTFFSSYSIVVRPIGSQIISL